MIDGTVDGLEIRLTSWHVKYPIIYRVLLPSKRWLFGISSINSSKHIELELYDAHPIFGEGFEDLWKSFMTQTSPKKGR